MTPAASWACRLYGCKGRVASAIHPIFRSPHAEYLMFSFPELVLVVMGILVWLGGYMGYRVADLIRFRELAAGGSAGGLAR